MSEEDIGKALEAVAPGRVTAGRTRDGVASLVLDVAGMTAAERDRIEAEIRERARALGIGEVRIAKTSERRPRKIIAVGSGKGGVGKSTVAANLAVALARMGQSVGLVDADIYGPSQPRIMGNSDKPDAIDKQLIPVTAQGVRMLSLGQLVPEGSALAWRGPMASNALAQMLDADWGDTQILVVDLPPGTGDVQLSLMQKWKPTGAVIVSTPQDLALIDAARAIDLFRKMDVPILGLVENMSGYACPSCGVVSDPFGAGGAEQAAKEMDIPFLGRIPLALTIRAASDAGAPPAAGDSEDAIHFREIAERMLSRLNRSAL